MTGSCSICISEPDAPVCPPCGHVYCSVCLDNHTASHTTTERGLRTSWCPNCRVPFPLETNLQHVPPEFRPFVSSAVRRLFLGEGSAELELESDEVPGVRKLKRRLRSETKANYRRRKEIERLNESLRVVEGRGQKARDDLAAWNDCLKDSLAACRSENNRLRDQRQCDSWKEVKYRDDLAACQRENGRLKDLLQKIQMSDRDFVLLGIGHLAVLGITIYLIVIACKVIPFRMLFNWYTEFLHTARCLWVELGYPLLLELVKIIKIQVRDLLTEIMDEHQ